MEEIVDSVGKLSMNAKEWVPQKDRWKSTATTTPSATATPYSPTLSATVAPYSPTPSSSTTSKNHTWSPTHLLSSSPWNDTTTTINPSNVVGSTPDDGGNNSNNNSNEVILESEEEELWRSYVWEIQQDLYNGNLLPDDDLYKALPWNYTNAKLLSSSPQQQTRNEWGYPSQTFRVFNTTTSQFGCLRRLDHVKCMNPIICQQLLQSSLSYLSGNKIPHVINLQTMTCPQKHTLYFVHDYLPKSTSLPQYLSSLNHHHHHTRHHHTNNWIVQYGEPLAWKCLLQLSMSILIFHQEYNVPCRSLSSLHHLLVTTKTSQNNIIFHMSHVGMAEALEYEARKSKLYLQQQDLLQLGNIIIQILLFGTNHRITTTNHNNQDDDVFAWLLQQQQNNISRDLLRVLHDGIYNNKDGGIERLYRVIQMFCPIPYVTQSYKASHNWMLFLERTTIQQYESTRLLKLLFKLAFINERPEFGYADPRWSETGDCYVLKLFRDYGTYKFYIYI